MPEPHHQMPRSALVIAFSQPTDSSSYFVQLSRQDAKKVPEKNNGRQSRTVGDMEAALNALQTAEMGYKKAANNYSLFLGIH